MTKTTDSTKTAGDAATRRNAQRPRDAATLIIADFASDPPRVLMGRRREDQVFMPGKYVFPGGRVDRTDRGVDLIDDLVDDLRPGEIAKLLLDMKGAASEGRARALALAAVRETFEEAGLLIGGETTRASKANAASWQRFHALGFAPRLDPLRFFARAITPPGRPRRYDTRFFCVDATAIGHRTAMRDDELIALHWLTLDETKAFDLPGITRVILEDLSEYLARGALPGRFEPVPYYFHRNGSFRRELLSPGSK